MKIGVIGYYGFGNAGDEAILESIRQFLLPHQVIAFTAGFPATDEAILRLNNFDFLILGGGGLYNRTPPGPFDLFDRWMDRLTSPIAVLGIGVERLDPAYLTATHKLVERAKIFTVRDEESRRLIGHPKILLAPDLTFYKLRQTMVRPRTLSSVSCGINLRPGRPRVWEWIRAISALPCSKRAIPFSIHPTFDDREPLLSIDPDCPDQFTPDVYDSFDVMVGTAFHSIVFAIQCGVPAIAINYHSKVRRLMEEVGLSDYVLEWDEWDQLQPCFQKLLTNHENIQRRMLDYTTRAQEELRQVLQEARTKVDEEMGKNIGVTLASKVEPRVSIIVPCQNSANDDISKTVSSCLGQTHSNLEVILVSKPSHDNESNSVLSSDTRIRLVTLNDDKPDWIKGGLKTATGKYVTWLHSGERYADDAIAVLVSVLESQPAVGLAYADILITHTDIIERKITIGRKYSSDKLDIFGVCFLARREQVCKFLDGKLDLQYSYGESFGIGSLQIAQIPHGLLLRPASESEIYLYRSIIAYGRGRVEVGKQFLRRTFDCDPEWLDWQKSQVLDLFEVAAHNCFITPDGEMFVKTVFQNLPKEAHGLRPLKKKLISRLAMAQFFESYHSQDWHNVFQAAWPGLWNDPSWLRIWGVWVILGKTLAATVPFNRYLSFHL